MRIRLAVLDRNQDYLNRFQTSMLERHGDELELGMHTEAESAIAELDRVDVFLADECFEIDGSKIPERCVFAYLTENADIASIRDCPAVSKYQKVESLYRDILNLYVTLDRNICLKTADNSDCKVLMFTSFAGGCGTSTIAAATAAAKAMSGKRTLFLDFSELGQSENLFDGAGAFSMTDVIMAMKKVNGGTAMKLESFLSQSAAGVDYYRSADTSLDMESMTDAEKTELISMLRSSGHFDCIVVDMPFRFDLTQMKLFGTAGRVMLVHDGTDNASLKTARALDALDNRATTGEDWNTAVGSFLDRLFVTYNRISSADFHRMTQADIGTCDGVKASQAEIRTCGGVRTCQGGTWQQKVLAIAENALFLRDI